jgi:hypothetical protein
MTRNATAETILERFNNAPNHQDGALVPYRKFSIDGNTYFFTHGGFLYRKDLATKEVGGSFCGYLTDEVWNYRIDDG